MPYKLVCFDLDGTLVDDVVFVWQAIHDHLKTDAKARASAYQRFRKGEITYQEWADHDLSMWRQVGATKRDILDAIANCRLMCGALETIQKLKAKGYKLAIISGSIDILLEKLIPDYRQLFDEVFINRIYFETTGKIKECRATPFDMEHKARALERICKKEHITPGECVFIGDNYNDVAIAELAGLSIAFNCKSDELAQVCDIVIKEKDLREILKYL